MRKIAIAVMMGIAFMLLVGCRKEQKKPVKVVRTVAAVQEDTVALPKVDIAMLSRSLVDALNMGEKLDSASYSFYGILTDGGGRVLYTDTEGHAGTWRVEVESPGSVVVRNLNAGNLLAEDLRVYVAQAVGLTDADVVDAGIVVGNDSAQAVVYSTKRLRMEMTLLPRPDSGGTEHAFVTIAFIRQ